MTPDHNAAVSPERARWYAPPALAQLPRLLSGLDRERHSASYGDFDREHWSWKFRDFPLGMLQTALYPLALVWRYPLPENPYHRNPRLLEWIVAAMEQTLRRQHRNGSFDGFCPNEQEPGVTVGIVHGLAEAFRVLVPHVPEPTVQRLLASLRRAMDYALPRDESHAFISNHQALFAVGFLDAHELLGDERCRARAAQVVARILEQQSPEGWFLEYEGADPGYESLGIQHLATYWRRTGAPELLEALRRSVEFYAHCVHPDGSAGGAYGSRNTSLYFPGGFELLAGELPMAAAVAAFLRARICRNNVVTPSSADAENLFPLLSSYLGACLATGGDLGDAAPRLPCEILTGSKRYQRSGFVFAGGPRYYAVVNERKGGVCRVFDRQAQKLVYEDAGYVVTGNGVKWTSQSAGMSQAQETEEPSKVSTSALFAEIRQELPGPWKFVLLRLLNLTVFRSPALGAWVRRQIVQRLILRKHAGPLRLRRRVVLGDNEIRFHDTIELLAPVKVEGVALPRNCTPIHMGSAKYFHPAELDELAAPDLRPLTALRSERKASIEFAIKFPAAGAPRLVEGAATEEREAGTREAVVER